MDNDAAMHEPTNVIEFIDVLASASILSLKRKLRNGENSFGFRNDITP